MSIIDREFQEVWESLRGQAPQRSNVLRAVHVRKLRGIGDLRVSFPYPVCVLAGANGCGKSTVLFACACAYRDPDRGSREFVPTSLFPNFIDPARGGISDRVDQTELEFDYLDAGASYAMAWRRGKSWNRSFLGRKGGRQPERSVYLRTLANLTNPSEVRGALQLARKPFKTDEITPELLILDHRVLPRHYRNLSQIRDRTRNLLFADVEGSEPTSYSEFHMSSGERALLRISKDVSGLDDALVLIDEVEAGLHPYTQKQAMLELQRIALRKHLQVIVASHSPVVLDSVPPEARVFLDRDALSNEVRVVPPYRDLFQKALYGQSQDKLSILCEDSIAEAVVRGFLDVLSPRHALRPDDFVIDRNTSRDEFPHHVRALGKFGRLKDFLLILDGDSRSMEGRIQAAAEAERVPVKLLFLPGDGPPERWIWNSLKQDVPQYAKHFGLSEDDLGDRLRNIWQITSGGVSQDDPVKKALDALAREMEQTPDFVARSVARVEAAANRGDVAVFLVELAEQIANWRGAGATAGAGAGTG